MNGKEVCGYKRDARIQSCGEGQYHEHHREEDIHHKRLSRMRKTWSYEQGKQGWYMEMPDMWSRLL